MNTARSAIPARRSPLTLSTQSDSSNPLEQGDTVLTLLAPNPLGEQPIPSFERPTQRYQQRTEAQQQASDDDDTEDVTHSAAQDTVSGLIS